MTAARVRLALTLIGLGLSVYLTAVHYHGAPLFCSTHGVIDCVKVVTSPQSVFLGLPLALWGVLWFAAAIALAVRSLGVAPPAWLRPARLWWSAAGAASVVYFIYLELLVIGSICAWCTAVHLIVLILLGMEAAAANP